MSSATHAAAQIDLEAVEAYLTKAIPGFRGPLSAEKTPTGQSNPTFILTAGSGDYVLRRKPPGPLLKSAHAVDREFRVMRALSESDAPVPEALHLCEDESVVGSVFYIMRKVEGRVLFDPAIPSVDNAARAKMYDDMNRCLAALHSVDFEAAGLGDFGKPGSYFARQLSRWTKQYRSSETEHIPDMEALIAWLEARVPADDDRTTLVLLDAAIRQFIAGAHIYFFHPAQNIRFHH